MKLTKDTLIEGKVYTKGTMYNIKEGVNSVDLKYFYNILSDRNISRLVIEVPSLSLKLIEKNPITTASNKSIMFKTKIGDILVNNTHIDEILAINGVKWDVVSAFEVILKDSNRLYLSLS